MPTVPDISIIIPTYNKATHLARLLPSILAQTVDPERYEVIIVDDGSTDGTPAVADQFKDQFIHFFYVRQDNQGIGGARNTGLRHARGSLISFLADDYVLAPSYLEKLSAQFENPDVQGVRPLFDSLGRTAVEMAVLAISIGGMKRECLMTGELLYAPSSVQAWGGAAMTRRSLFDQHGPFLETFATGEDSEYARRLDHAGVRIHVYNAVLFQIQNRTSFSDACRRFHQYAVNGVKIQRAFPSYASHSNPRRRSIVVRLARLVVNPVTNTFACADSFLQAIRVAPLTLSMSLVAVFGACQTRWQLRKQGHRQPITESSDPSIAAVSAEVSAKVCARESVGESTRDCVLAAPSAQPVAAVHTPASITTHSSSPLSAK